MERSYGSFRRVFEFTTPVDADGVSARFERGVLEIKAMKARSGRSIPVQEGR
jgi:HSP20 family molecular chaperone IbpA